MAKSIAFVPLDPGNPMYATCTGAGLLVAAYRFSVLHPAHGRTPPVAPLPRIPPSSFPRPLPDVVQRQAIHCNALPVMGREDPAHEEHDRMPLPKLAPHVPDLHPAPPAQVWQNRSNLSTTFGQDRRYGAWGDRGVRTWAGRGRKEAAWEAMARRREGEREKDSAMRFAAAIGRCAKWSGNASAAINRSALASSRWSSASALARLMCVFQVDLFLPPLRRSANVKICTASRACPMSIKHAATLLAWSME
eukprot:1958117-Rhodomonas_salina.3